MSLPLPLPPGPPPLPLPTPTSTSAVGSGSEYVRFAPWFPYPRVVVTELEPPDCTATKPATNWNSTLFDGVMRDFMRCASFCQKEGP